MHQSHAKMMTFGFQQAYRAFTRSVPYVTIVGQTVRHMGREKGLSSLTPAVKVFFCKICFSTRQLTMIFKEGHDSPFLSIKAMLFTNSLHSLL